LTERFQLGHFQKNDLNDWKRMNEIQYLRWKFSVSSTKEKGNTPNWEKYVKPVLDKMLNLKACCIINTDRISEDLDSIFPGFGNYLQSRQIKEISESEFENKIKFFSQNLPFVFHYIGN